MYVKVTPEPRLTGHLSITESLLGPKETKLDIKFNLYNADTSKVRKLIPVFLVTPYPAAPEQLQDVQAFLTVILFYTTFSWRPKKSSVM